jgi:methylase of polypeptide subunit release factors
MPPRTLEPAAVATPDETHALDRRAELRAFVTDALGLAPTPRRVLDLGTGTARAAILLATRAPLVTVTGVDVSPSALRRAAGARPRAGVALPHARACADPPGGPPAPRWF